MTRPNIVVFLVDNLGFGELGCYGGGPLRGAETTRIDEFASEGVQLTNFAPEAQCMPARSAMLTGRYAVRSGTYRIPMDGSTEYGLVAWERCLSTLLREQGYATSLVGKWHLGEAPGRLPGDHGFDEWYGPERTYDECLWPQDPFYDPERDPESWVLESEGDEAPRRVARLDLDTRVHIDTAFHERASRFIRRSAEAEQPFFLLYCHSMLHLPTVPRPEFAGRSRSGDWGDCLLELDHDFGALLDELEAAGVADDTIVVFLGDNGAEESLPWRGSSGFFDGSYFTGMEGSLRTPCLVRWPGHTVAGKRSNDLVHIADCFTTLARWAGAEVPGDRHIDGVDQRELFETPEGRSARDGFPFWNADTLYGVKWGDWKLSFYEQRGMWDQVAKLAMPKLVNLLIDPTERENVLIHHTWVTFHTGRVLRELEASLRTEPPIPYGAPVDHVPERSHA